MEQETRIKASELTLLMSLSSFMIFLTLPVGNRSDRINGLIFSLSSFRVELKRATQPSNRRNSQLVITGGEEMSHSHKLVIKRSSVSRPPTPTPDANKDHQDQKPSLREINTKLIESGEKERLKELLRERLIECGWRDEMKALCRAFTRKKGRNNVTVDDLVHVITPKGRASVPDSVKAELLQRIRTFLASTAA